MSDCDCGSEGDMRERPTRLAECAECGHPEAWALLRKIVDRSYHDGRPLISDWEYMSLFGDETNPGKAIGEREGHSPISMGDPPAGERDLAKMIVEEIHDPDDKMTTEEKEQKVRECLEKR